MESGRSPIPNNYNDKKSKQPTSVNDAPVKAIERKRALEDKSERAMQIIESGYALAKIISSKEKDVKKSPSDQSAATALSLNETSRKKLKEEVSDEVQFVAPNKTTDWLFQLKQIAEPQKERPEDLTGLGKRNRRRYHPRTKQIEEKPPKDPNIIHQYTKKTATSLLPGTGKDGAKAGRMMLFGTDAQYGNGLLIDARLANLKDNKYVFHGEAMTFNKWWKEIEIDEKNDVKKNRRWDEYKGITLEELRLKLRDHNQIDKKPTDYSEVLACLDKRSLIGIFFQSHTRNVGKKNKDEYRIEHLRGLLDTIKQQGVVKIMLGIDLPILILNADTGVSVYSIEAQIDDIKLYEELNKGEDDLSRHAKSVVSAFIIDQQISPKYQLIATLQHLVEMGKFDQCDKLIEEMKHGYEADASNQFDVEYSKIISFFESLTQYKMLISDYQSLEMTINKDIENYLGQINRLDAELRTAFIKKNDVAQDKNDYMAKLEEKKYIHTLIKDKRNALAALRKGVIESSLQLKKIVAKFNLESSVETYLNAYYFAFVPQETNGEPRFSKNDTERKLSEYELASLTVKAQLTHPQLVNHPFRGHITKKLYGMAQINKENTDMDESEHCILKTNDAMRDCIAQAKTQRSLYKRLSDLLALSQVMLNDPYLDQNIKNYVQQFVDDNKEINWNLNNPQITEDYLKAVTATLICNQEESIKNANQQLDAVKDEIRENQLESEHLNVAVKIDKYSPLEAQKQIAALQTATTTQLYLKKLKTIIQEIETREFKLNPLGGKSLPGGSAKRVSHGAKDIYKLINSFLKRYENKVITKDDFQLIVKVIEHEIAPKSVVTKGFTFFGLGARNQDTVTFYQETMRILSGELKQYTHVNPQPGNGPVLHYN